VAVPPAGPGKLNRRLQLVRLLADGREHSGEALAAALDVSRAAVWKQVRQLSAWGLEVEAAAGRGYRLAAPLDLLDERVMLAALPGRARDRLRRLVLADELASTNETLLAVTDLVPGNADLCLAEFQSAGRGRRGRQWLAPFGSGICLSVSWCFAEAPPQLSALSLAAGVAVRRALAGLGIGGIELKWPNDILWRGRKLGGILCELRIEAAGPAYVVIGVGLNLRLPAAVRAAIRETGLEVASLDEMADSGPPARSALAVALVNQLLLSLEEFELAGFQPFFDEWSAADALAGRAARVEHGATISEGIARGIDLDGALLLEVGGRIERFVSGEASLRPIA
jgi:BirA family biotin operon repressor/biotin-[acetyl-CoA-carboxylase] ligase